MYSSPSCFLFDILKNIFSFFIFSHCSSVAFLTLLSILMTISLHFLSGKSYIYIKPTISLWLTSGYLFCLLFTMHFIASLFSLSHCLDFGALDKRATSLSLYRMALCRRSLSPITPDRDSGHLLIIFAQFNFHLSSWWVPAI